MGQAKNKLNKIDTKEGIILRIPVIGWLSKRTMTVWFCPYVHGSYILNVLAKQLSKIYGEDYAPNDVKFFYPNAKIRVYGKCNVDFTTPKHHQESATPLVVNKFPIDVPDESIKLIITYNENDDI